MSSYCYQMPDFLYSLCFSLMGFTSAWHSCYIIFHDALWKYVIYEVHLSSMTDICVAFVAMGTHALNYQQSMLTNLHYQFHKSKIVWSNLKKLVRLITCNHVSFFFLYVWCWFMNNACLPVNWAYKTMSERLLKFLNSHMLLQLLMWNYLLSVFNLNI